MKNYFFHNALFLLFLFGFTIACGSMHRTPTDVDKERISLDSKEITPKNYETTSNSWEHMLNRVSGLMIAGTYPNFSIKIRGSFSIYADTEPLFVVDGTPLAGNFSALAQTVNVTDVKSIRVLRGPEASMYGTRGGNGVIVVKTKKE